MQFRSGNVTEFWFIAASYVGLKEYLPPYLDPNLSMEDLMTGVSFASAGSGFDPLTPRISVSPCTYLFIYIYIHAHTFKNV